MERVLNQERSLKIGVSGVRGIVGETLTPQLLASFAEAFGSYVGRGKVLVGSDTRTSKDMVKYAVFSGLLSSGCEPVDLGICPIPTLLIRTKYSKAAGGIAITASHNPVQWNALKFINKDGLLLNANQAEELLDVYHQGEFFKCNNSEIKNIKVDDGAIPYHLEKIFNYIDVDAIRRRKFRVAIDCCNGAGSLITPILLKKFGCEVISINVEPNGLFPHDPEPISKNIVQICSLVKSKKADIGFVQDADADRLAIVDENGNPIGEDYTLVLVVDYILSKKRGSVVTNLSATKAVDDVASKYGCRVIRAKVGEINVVEKVASEKAIVGGEGNGGVIIPAIHPCRDSLAGIGIILEYLAKSKLKLSENVKKLPRYYMIKGKVYCETAKAHSVVRRLQNIYKKAKLTLLNGIKVEAEDHWIHIRPSNTEPIIRVIVEARTKKAADQLYNQSIKDIAALLNKA
ncbi:MAG: phosphoglucosamine mutase [Candidatus Omnitrophota bacterium]